MDQTGEFVRQNSGILGTVALIAVFIAILYVVYTYLYPADDPTFTQFLKGEADARRPVPVTGKVPAIYTGGDFTLSFWIYIDDFNYRAASSKFLFALSPEILGSTSTSPLVGCADTSAQRSDGACQHSRFRRALWCRTRLSPDGQRFCGSQYQQ